MTRSPLASVLLTVFIDLLGFGLVIPILPYYATSLGASGFALGWLLTSFSLMQFLFSPVWGAISDRVGRKPVLLLTIAGTGFALLASAYATSLIALCLARVLAGLFSANISTAYALVSDITDERGRARAMGLIGAAFGVGFIVGPAAGGWLSRYGLAAPFWAASALCGINFVLAWVQIAEPNLDAEARAARRQRRPSLLALGRVLRTDRVGTPVGLFFLLTLAVTQMEVTFALYLARRFDLDAAHAGSLLGVMGLVMALVQGGGIGPLTRRLGSERIARMGFVVCALGLATFALAPSVPLVVVALVVLALGHGSLHPTLSSLASLGAAPTERGVVMGMFQSAGSLARMIGPPLAGLAFDSGHLTLPYWQGVAALGVGAMLALRSQELNATPPVRVSTGTDP